MGTSEQIVKDLRTECLDAYVMHSEARNATQPYLTQAVAAGNVAAQQQNADMIQRHTKAMFVYRLASDALRDVLNGTRTIIEFEDMLNVRIAWSTDKTLRIYYQNVLNLFDSATADLRVSLQPQSAMLSATGPLFHL